MKVAVFPTALLEQKRKLLKQRLAMELNTARLFCEIDKIYELTGARVVYIDAETTDVVLREFQPTCRIRPNTLVLREAPKALSVYDFAATLKQNKRDSELVGEIVSTGLGCAAAVLSWLVIFGASTTIPFSAGASTTIVIVSYAAATASAVQCGNGLLRSGLEVGAPEFKDWLDSRAWYTNAALAVDAISLAGAAATFAGTINSVKILKVTSSKPLLDILKGLTRSERKRLTQEIIRLNHPNVSSKVMKNLIRMGRYPSRYSQPQISDALALRIKDTLGANFSALGSLHSGTVNGLAVGLYEAWGDL